MALKEMPDAEMWIIGGGPEKTALEAHAKRMGLESRVQFLGVGAAEGDPRVAQAVRHRRACDATGRIPGLFVLQQAVRIHSHGQGGYRRAAERHRHYFSDGALAFFEPNNPTDLAKQMIRMYGNPNLRAQYAAAARAE